MNQDILEMAHSHLVNVEQALAGLYKQREELEKEIVKITDYLQKGKEKLAEETKSE
jgi:predicted  nucleic acid-binding Zn-ribbon protein